MKKLLLLVFGALVALPCAQIMGQDSLHIKELGVYLKLEDVIPPIPPVPTDSFAIIDNAVKGIQGYQNNYTGSWSDGTNDAWYAKTLTYTGNGSVSFRFNGTKIEVFTEKGPTHGIISIVVDSTAAVTVDLYATAFHQQVKVFEKVTTQDIHTIKLSSTGTKNPASTNTYLLLDYFKVTKPGFVPDIAEPPVPLPPDADVVVPIGGSIKAMVEGAASGTTVGLLEGQYSENSFTVPPGVSLVGAGKLKSIIVFTGSMPQQSESAMIMVKGGASTQAAPQAAAARVTLSIVGVILLILLWLVANEAPFQIKMKRLLTAIIILIIVIIIIYLSRPQATTTSSGGAQTVSGFTIKGNFQCNGGIMVDGRNDVKVLDVKVQETTYFGVWLKNTTGTEFANSELLNTSWASVGWVTGELAVHNITNVLIHHNTITTTRTDKGYGVKALWPDGTVTSSKFYSNKFNLVHTSIWNNGSAPNIDIELHDTYYAGIEIYDNDFSTMGLSLAGHKPPKSGMTHVHDNRFTWSSTAAIEIVCSDLLIEHNTFSGSPMMTANFQPNGKWTNITVNDNVFNSNAANPGWGGLHLIGPDGMDMTITNNKYNNTHGYPLVKHMGNPASSTVVQSGNVIN